MLLVVQFLRQTALLILMLSKFWSQGATTRIRGVQVCLKIKHHLREKNKSSKTRQLLYPVIRQCHVNQHKGDAGVREMEPKNQYALNQTRRPTNEQGKLQNSTTKPQEASDRRLQVSHRAPTTQARAQH